MFILQYLRLRLGHLATSHTPLQVSDESGSYEGRWAKFCSHLLGFGPILSSGGLITAPFSLSDLTLTRWPKAHRCVS